MMSDEEYGPSAEKRQRKSAQGEPNLRYGVRRDQSDALEPVSPKPGGLSEIEQHRGSRDQPRIGADYAGLGTAGTGISDRDARSGHLQDRAADLAVPVRIAIWGAPGSGKTTFLAALGFAVGRDSRSAGKWAIYPNDQFSAEVLTRNMHHLLIERRFPLATPPGSIEPLSLTFRGDLGGTKFASRRRFWQRGPATTSFQLNLADVSGEAFGSDPDDLPIGVTDAVLDTLVNAQGLIYIFDPVGERYELNSAQYVNRTLTQLRTRMAGQVSGRFLPQQLSVCITKFDHPIIFIEARRLNLVQEDPDGTFRVPDSAAELFFDLYCDGRFRNDERSFGSAKFVRDRLKAYFDPQHIRYFVTSSIGLRRRLDESTDDQRAVAKVNLDDFTNVAEDEDGPVIRGLIDPINVLEPLISLQQRITGHRHRKI